jgi:hypothetical protein
MFFDDHAPPHFHVEYGDDRAIIDIRRLAIIGGNLPSRALGMTVEWASLHREELLALWERAKALEPLERIEPLP